MLDKLIVVPVLLAVPIFETKPSRLDRKAKLVGPVPEACPVYTKLERFKQKEEFGVNVHSKYAVRSIEAVFQLLALYRSFAVAPTAPMPREIPLTVMLGLNVCPVV